MERASDGKGTGKGGKGEGEWAMEIREKFASLVLGG